MEKIDLKGEYRQLYRAGAKGPEFVEVPALPYLMIDGKGSPDSVQFQDAVQALYSLAYGLKAEFKKNRDVEYQVMPLEGLWATKSGLAPADAYERDTMRWTLLIMVMYLIDPDDVESVREAIARKKKGTLPALSRVSLGTFDEGLSAQILHTGPYAEEPASLERLHAFISEQGYRVNGRHHEVYLSDPSRTAPEKIRTILRYPVRKKR